MANDLTGCRSGFPGKGPRPGAERPFFPVIPMVVFVWFLGTAAFLGAEEMISVIMPARVSLVPWTLDTVKKVLERDLGRTVSLSVRSGTAFHWPDPSAAHAWLLLEEGAPAPADLQPTGVQVSLLWMLGVRSELLAHVASGCPTRLDEFFGVLNALRTRSPDVFPWFESLYSPETLRRFTMAFSRSGNPIGSRETFAALRPLHRGLNGKLLNPLSMESDEGLAFDVFEAGDAVFSSMWVVEDAWPPGSLLRGTLSGALFVPLPGPTGPGAVPQMRFSLWARDKASLEGLHPHSHVASFPFPVVRLEAKEEAAWARDRFSQVYDQLVQGGNE